ncbi:lymphocyte activation gene 3 protein-like isoform X6 [Dicentrarchus labrax]|uniref:lymphocyte activation gene 3 protein-like isoform X6 n=1 Tax=Dicentrarchus labrax TaxID=13489 RepID=UPI0021F57704|nr:lymphocyte activation gene 3 protein-like isoform X6 [Dicentrarchus labrax]
MDTIMTLCTCIETEKTILLSRRSPLKGELLSFVRGLTKGNLSLKLSTVALSDAGRYRCSIHTDKLQKSCYVNLTVGESKVIGSHDPVTVRVGYDVILPCHLEPPFDVRTLTVKWTRNKTVVHVSRHGKDYLNDQDENFRNRTSLFHEEMTNGNISLKLTKVTELDAGSYTCNVPCLQSQVRRGFINLTIEPADQTETKQTTDCARPNTTGHNGQNREGSQEDNAEDNNEDSAEDNAEDNNEDSAEENAEDNNEDSAEH